MALIKIYTRAQSKAQNALYLFIHAALHLKFIFIKSELSGVALRINSCHYHEIIFFAGMTRYPFLQTANWATFAYFNNKF